MLLPTALNAFENAVPTPLNELDAISSLDDSVAIAPDIAPTPALLITSNAGANLVARVALSPSAASPTVLYCCAIARSDLSFPAFSIALKKSSVLTLPACTLATSSLVVMPILAATRDSPAGDCSSISLKSCHATIGFAAICVACVDNVFMACLGFSDAAATAPNPFTTPVVVFLLTA